MSRKERKRYIKSHPEFWLKRGYSQPEADEMAEKHKGYNSKYSKNYWLLRGYTEEEAKKHIEEYKKTRVPFANGGRSNQTSYWTKKGYSLDEAKQKVSERQDTTSLAALCKTYGEEDGKKRYDEIIKNKSQTTCFRDSEMQRELSNRTRHKIKYWLDKGLSPDDAEQARIDWISNNNSFCIDYWLKQGLSLEEAKQRLKENSTKASRQRKTSSATSLIEEDVFEYISEIYPDAEQHVKIMDDNQRRYWFPDIVTDKFILEVFGDFWHANPDYYDEDDVLFQNKTARQIRITDKKRITRLQRLTNKPVIVVWESELNQNGFEVINAKIEKSLRNEISQ